MLSQSEIESQFQTFVDADGESPSDILLRRILVTIAALVVSYTQEQLIFLIWGLGFVCVDFVYIKSLTWPGEATRARFWTACATSALVAGWVGFMSIYLVWFDNGQLYFLALCMFVGQVLHCLSGHSSFGAAVYVEAGVVVLTVVGMTLGTLSLTTSAPNALGIVVGAVTVLAYFVYCLKRAVSHRSALKARMEAETQDQKMRALGQLTSGVAHDFNNVLAVIYGNIELAQTGRSDAKRERYLTNAMNASETASSLVKQLLAYTRKSSLREEDVDAGEIAARVAEVAARVLPENIELCYIASRERIKVRADTAMLETAVLNLIINSRDALNGKPGQITLSVELCDTHGTAGIVVTDTGSGMSADVLERATDPFFTTKEFGEGSGLGLSMVKGFVEQSGGELQLSNVEPHGLRAAVCLPVREVEDVEPEMSVAG